MHRRLVGEAPAHFESLGPTIYLLVFRRVVQWAGRLDGSSLRFVGDRWRWHYQGTDSRSACWHDRFGVNPARPGKVVAIDAQRAFVGVPVGALGGGIPSRRQACL
jgi:hypothetical protein